MQLSLDPPKILQIDSLRLHLILASTADQSFVCKGVHADCCARSVELTHF